MYTNIDLLVAGLDLTLACQPGPPHSFLFGHLPVAIKMATTMPLDIHPQAFCNWLRMEYNLGNVFYFDPWPLGPQTCYITDPDVANHVTIDHSLSKADALRPFLNPLLGKENMVGLEGQKWKIVRSMFNPGFAGGHLMSLVPDIVDDCLVFCEILKEKAKSGEVFSMEEIATRLTVDIIGRITL